MVYTFYLFFGFIQRTEMKTVLGIDLGTGNSCVSYLTESGEIKPVSFGNQNTIPSIVYLDTEKWTEESKNSNGTENSNKELVKTFKRYFGVHYEDCLTFHEKCNPSVSIGERNSELVFISKQGKEYSPQDLTEILLLQLLKGVQNFLGSSVTIEGCVLTVPAHFSHRQRQMMKSLAEKHIRVFSILNEPTASVLSHEHEKKGIDEEHVVVIDIGSGTTDMTLLSVKEDNVFQVLGTSGNAFLGGEDILLSFFEEVKKKVPFSIKNENIFLEEVQKCIHGLSTKESYLFVYSEDQSYQRNISRSFFEYTIRDITKKIGETVFGLFQRQRDITLFDITKIFLTGGVSRTPCIQKEMERVFQKKVTLVSNPDTSISIGATHLAQNYITEKSKVTVLDVTPISLGLETQGGCFDFLIPRNSTIPAHTEKEYVPDHFFSTHVNINVYEGERKLAKYNHLLATYTLPIEKRYNIQTIQPKKIKVSFLMDESGLLNVKARQGKNVLDVKVKYNETLRKSLLENNRDYYEYDNAMKEYITQRTKVESLCRGMMVNMKVNRVLCISDISKEEQQLFDLIMDCYQEIKDSHDHEKVENEPYDIESESIEEIEEDTKVMKEMYDDIIQKCKSYKRSLGEYKGIDGKFSTKLFEDSDTENEKETENKPK